MLCRVISYSYSSLLVVCPPAGHDHTETHSCPGLVKKSFWTTGPSMWSSHVEHFCFGLRRARSPLQHGYDSLELFLFTVFVRSQQSQCFSSLTYRLRVLLNDPVDTSSATQGRAGSFILSAVFISQPSANADQCLLGFYSFTSFK